MRMRLLFFDVPRVQRAMDAATRRALSKAGAFISQRAKTAAHVEKVYEEGNFGELGIRP